MGAACTLCKEPDCPAHHSADASGSVLEPYSEPVFLIPPDNIILGEE